MKKNILVYTATLICTHLIFLSLVYGCSSEKKSNTEDDGGGVEEQIENAAEDYKLQQLESENKIMSTTVYSFEANTLGGEKVSLDKYKGKVLLIVNTASECGFTPQYEGLQKLYEEYKEKGLEILAFPCNQFGGQEPGGSSEIANFCEMNYGVSFSMFEKVDVNGENEHPLFTFLKSEQSGLVTDAIKWNFTKFLVDKSGNPVGRFAPQTKPLQMVKDIEALL